VRLAVFDLIDHDAAERLDHGLYRASMPIPGKVSPAPAGVAHDLNRHRNPSLELRGLQE
jgi:hypothetical protein